MIKVDYYYIISLIIPSTIMTTNDDDKHSKGINKKQRENKGATNNVEGKEIEETLENASDKTVKESKKESNVIGDSDRE